MKLEASKWMKGYAGVSFPEKKEAINILNLMVLVYFYSLAMFLLDLILNGNPIFILIETLAMTAAMAFVFGLWYFGHMDVAILITGFYGIAFTMLIFFEEEHMRFDMQLLMVLLVTIIGFHHIYQYVLTLLTVVPLVVIRMLQEDTGYKYVVFVVMTLAVATVFLILMKWGLRREIMTSYSLKQAQETDVLTGLPNRRNFENNLRQQMKLKPSSLMLLDLDHFKSVNDSYGHSVGDQVLMEFADILREETGKDARIFRWGGEEFMIVVFGDKKEALSLGESIRYRTERYYFSESNRLTVSVGIADCRQEGNAPNDCFFRADKALYRAKSNGRNRVVAFTG